MTRKIMLTAAACATLLFGVAFAQDEHELEGAMKTAGAASGSLRKTIAGKNAPATAANAEQLEAVFKQVQAHFEEHHMEDGIRFARTAREASVNLAEAAKAGEWGKVSAEMKTIGAQCQACHAAHREKAANGTYRMK